MPKAQCHSARSVRSKTATILTAAFVVTAVSLYAARASADEKLPTTRPATTAPASPEGRYEKEIAAFEAADRQSPPAKGGILFVGDSGIKKWVSLAADFPGQPVINRGFGGSKMADLLLYTDRIVIPYQPRLIIVREGGNDLTSGVTPEQLLAQFQTFVDKVHTALPDTRIAFFSLNPNPARWAKPQPVNAPTR